MNIYTSQTHQSPYCVYITIYCGNKLPPFYIGSTSTEKIKLGYKGSVSSKEYGKIWKQELRDNPALFKSIILSEHSTREEAFDREEYLQKARKVVTNSLYVNRSYANSKFSLKEHTSWTRNKFKERIPWNKGLKLTDEKYKSAGRKNKGKIKGPLPENVKDKLRGPNPKKSNPGNKNGMFGKTHSDNVKAARAVDAVLRFKEKSYEELYGTEKAAELKKKRSESAKGKNHVGANNPRAKLIYLRTPTGEIFTVAGALKKFCVEHELDCGAIINVLKGRRDEYKGWKAEYAG